MQTGDKVKLVKALSGLPSTTDDATIYFNASDHKIYLGNQSYGDGTTYSSKAAASGGTDVSLVTTGEKYTWNSSDLAAKAFFGTCSTAAATAAKVVTLSNAAGWNLVPGVVIGVKFTCNNNANNVTLNVNGSGAKSIYFGNAVYTGKVTQITGLQNYIIYYMYDGTNWVFLNNSGNYIDINTDTKVTQTVTTESADYEVLFSATADNTTRTETARKNSNLLFNPSTGNLQTTQLNGVTIGSSPKFTDTTYSFTNGENSFTVTPSSGSAQTVEVTPSLEKSATNSFDDGIDSYFKKVVSTIVPVQAGSGTPSPTNVRAISGFTKCVVKDFGKNFMPQKDVSVPDTQTNVAINLDLPKGTYTISANISTDGSDTSFRYNIRLNNIAYANGFLDTSGGRSSSTFTIDQDCNQVYLYGGASSLTQANTTYTDIQIERGSTATDYTPYVAPNTATISFGSAGTVYGGYVDLISGKLVVDKVSTDLGTKNWSYINNRFYYNPTDAKIYNANDEANLLCSHYSTSKYTSQPNDSISSYSGYIYVRADEYNGDKVAFKVAMSGAQLVYELATPVEYQLTPAQLRSLVGANRLTSSTGEVIEVEYITNETIAYVDDKVESIVDTNSTFTFTLYGVPYASLTTANTDITQYSSATVANIKAAINSGKMVVCRITDNLSSSDYFILSMTVNPNTANMALFELRYNNKYYVIRIDLSNNKILSGSWGVAASTTSIATSYNTNQLTLANNTKYALTAGGSSFVFTTPPYENSIIATVTMLKDQVLSFMETTFNVGSLCDKTPINIWRAIDSFQNNHKTSNIYIKLDIENDDTEYLLQYVGHLETNDAYYFVYDNFSRTVDYDDDDSYLRHIEFVLKYNTSTHSDVSMLTFRHKPLIASIGDIGMVRIGTIRSGLQIDSDGTLSAPGADYVHTISTTSANFVTGADLTAYCSDSTSIRSELRGVLFASEASTNVRLNIRLDNSREMIAVPFSNFTTNSSGTFAIFKTQTLDIDDSNAITYKNIIISVSSSNTVTLVLYGAV